MSGHLDDKARALAERLLVKFGKVANYSQDGGFETDPVTGEDVQNPPNLSSITCYIDTQKTGEMASKGLISNTETVILVSAKDLGIEPKAGDDIVFPHAKYSIKSFNAIWSGELVALYEVVGLR